MKILAYILTILGTLVGGYTFFDTMLMAETVQHQIAGVAMAMAWAILPYIFARAVEKIGEVTGAEAVERYSGRDDSATQHRSSQPSAPVPQLPSRSQIEFEERARRLRGTTS